MADSLRLGIYEKALPNFASWHERLDSAKAAGFDFVEMSVDESSERLDRLDWSAAERRAVRNAIAASGVPITTMCLSAHRKFALGSASAEIRHRSLDVFRKAIDLAEDLGIRIIQLAGYYVYYEPHDVDCRRRYQEGLAAGIECAAPSAVMLALENVDGDDVMSISKAMPFVEMFNSPWFQIYPDIGNLAEHGLDVCDELERGAGHIVGVHVKDTRPGEPRRVPFGHGVVPFVAAFRKLAEMNFVGPVVLEMWNDDSPDSLSRVKQAREWVVERMAEGNLATVSPIRAKLHRGFHPSDDSKETMCRDLT